MVVIRYEMKPIISVRGFNLVPLIARRTAEYSHTPPSKYTDKSNNAEGKLCSVCYIGNWDGMNLIDWLRCLPGVFLYIRDFYRRFGFVVPLFMNKKSTQNEKQLHVPAEDRRCKTRAFLSYFRSYTIILTMA